MPLEPQIFACELVVTDFQYKNLSQVILAKLVEGSKQQDALPKGIIKRKTCK